MELNTYIQIIIALASVCVVLILYCISLRIKRNELEKYINGLHSKRFTLDLPAQAPEQTDDLDELKKEIDDLTQKNYDLKQQLAVEKDWKTNYFALNGMYYKLYSEYVKNPTATVTDLFPIDEKTVDIIKLHTDLRYANDKIDEFRRQISNHKRTLIEAKNENDVLKFELEELNSTIKEYELLKIKYQELEEEKNDSWDIFDKHKQILSALKKNASLFYDKSNKIKQLYAKMDVGRLCRAFDPTLCFIEAEYKIAHEGDSYSEAYTTTLTSCSCDDFKKNTKGNKPCKHMIFLAYNLGNMFINKEETDKYFNDINFIAQKPKLEAEIKKLKDKKKSLKKEI